MISDDLLLNPAASPAALHAPDGFMSLPIAAAGYVLSAIAVAYAVRRTRVELKERQVPLMGVMAAFIFAAQMLNFPVAGGTSGHLIGGALAAILLGPWAALLVMTSVIGLQALVFQDGGLIVMGANIFNMGVVSCLAGYGVYVALGKMGGESSRGIFARGFVAAWVSVFLGALAAAAELAISGTSPWSVAVPAMAGVHTLIGIGEGLITAAALALVTATRRDLLPIGVKGERGT